MSVWVEYGKGKLGATVIFLPFSLNSKQAGSSHDLNHMGRGQCNRLN